MSEEYDNDNSSFSPFWPLLILLVGLNGSLIYQVFVVNSQRSSLNAQFTAPQTQQTIEAAKNWQGRYGSIMKDLNDTSAKSQNAAAILKDAVQAGIQSGLIRVQPGTGTNAAPAAPTAPATK